MCCGACEICARAIWLEGIAVMRARNYFTLVKIDVRLF